VTRRKGCSPSCASTFATSPASPCFRAGGLKEVRHLRWSDLNYVERTARVILKGGKTAQRPLTEDMLVLIANQPKVSPFVFTYVCQKSRKRFVDKRGRLNPARLADERYCFTQWGWRSQWAKALKEAGIAGFRFHDLRHTRGSRILRHTGNLAIVQKALAHRSIKTSLRYAHASDDDVRRGLDASESRTIPDAKPTSAREVQKTGKN
jgi:integrase